MDANHPLRIVIVEDVPSDAELAERELRNSGFQFTSVRVDTKEGFLKALEEFQPHLIISDYAMPEFDGMQALRLSLERDATIPFIVLTGSMNEETAVACMKAGATDYVLKDRLARLPFAVREALEKEAAEQALLKSEEKYRLLFDSANEAIFVVQDGKMVFLNPMTVMISGYSSEELTARPFTEFCHPDDGDMVIDRHIRRMKGDEIPHIYSFRIIHKDGSIKWVELNAVLIDWNGKAASLNFLSDVTERKRMEEESKKYLAELEKKSEEIRMISHQLLQAEKLATMGELSASIAHELNNPLATVSLRVESLLEKTPEDSSNRRELDIIEQEVERMSKLIANLLQFSRRGQPQISTVNVCEEIEKTIELIYYHLRKHNISIMRQFARDVPEIQADRQQLRQLFLNLFTNAIDAMPRGGMLTIVVAVNGEGEKIRIEIADTGTGIPPEILSKVSEPFFTTKPEGKGTGLGLAICRRIAQGHQGTIEITSDATPGKGTRVCLTLPISDSSTVDYLCE